MNFLKIKQITINAFNDLALLHDMIIRKILTHTLPVITVGLLSAPFASALNLEEVVQQTLASNPDVEAARKELLAREYEIKGAKSGYRPTIDAELGVGYEWTKSPATANESVELTRKEAALRLRQLIYAGGEVSKEVARQRARYESAKFQAAATEANTALRATEVYLNVIRQSELLVLLRDSLDTHQNIFDQMQLRSDAGVGSQSDLDQIAARLALAKSNYLAGDNNLKDAVTNFYRVVGYVPDQDVLMVPSEMTVTASLEDALSRAYEQHPQLLSANADILAAEAQYDASTVGNYPRVSLEADRTWNDDIDGIEGTNEDLVVALRLRYRLYGGGETSARKKQTAELLEQAIAIRNSTKRQVEESLRLSWYAHQATSQQIEFLSDYVDTVQATKEAYEKQFSINRRTFLDLLNTQNELLEARQNYVNIKHDKLFSQYRIAHGEGQLGNKVVIK